MNDKEQPIKSLAHEGCRRKYHDVRTGQRHETPSDARCRRHFDKITMGSPLVHYGYIRANIRYDE